MGQQGASASRTTATAAMPRRLRRTVALAGFAVLGPAAALAADLAAPLAPAARYTDWSGPYLGLEGSASGSYGAYSFGPSTVGGRGVPAFKSGDSTGRSDRGRDATTAVGGAYAGWNWQDGPWLYGIEAALDAANLKRPVPSTIAGFGYQGVDPAFDVIRAKTDVYGTLRARLGYSFDRYLVYATFGLAGANARVLATYPDLGTGAVSTAKTNLGYVGFTLGAGVQYAISDTLALGLDYRYVDLGESGRFSLGAVPGLGPVTSRASFTSNQMFLRLMWFPGGLRVPPDPDETAPHDPDNGDTGRFSLHGQTTLIAQGVPGFRSPYLGDQSLIPHQARQTTTATIFLGLKLAEGRSSITTRNSARASACRGRSASRASSTARRRRPGRRSRSCAPTATTSSRRSGSAARPSRCRTARTRWPPATMRSASP